MEPGDCKPARTAARTTSAVERGRELAPVGASPATLRALDSAQVEASNGKHDGPPTDPGPATRTIRLEPRAEDLRRRPRLEAPGPFGWFVPPLALAAIGVGFVVVRARPANLFPWVVGALVLGVVGWVLISALTPAKADRRCPQCGADSLERLYRNTTRGLRCGRCAWQDETASSFFLAEDELTALEDVVLHERHMPNDGPPRRI